MAAPALLGDVQLFALDVAARDGVVFVEAKLDGVVAFSVRRTQVVDLYTTVRQLIVKRQKIPLAG